MRNGLLTLYGLGRYKYSGSVASLIATLFYSVPALLLPLWILGLTMLVFIFILVYSFILLHRFRYELEPRKEIIIDEFAGAYLCMMVAIPDNMHDILFLFVIFRGLDLLKIPPFTWLERTLDPRWGIMAGDIAIGLSVGLLYGLLV